MEEEDAREDHGELFGSGTQEDIGCEYGTGLKSGLSQVKTNTCEGKARGGR